MALKMKGFDPGEGTGINMGVLPEVKLTDKYPSKKARRKGEERKLTQKLHKNPVIKAVHGGTDKAADTIKKVASTGSLFYSGGALMSGAARALKGAGKFNLSKVKDSIINKIKKTTKTVAPYADDVAIGVANIKANKKNK